MSREMFWKAHTLIKRNQVTLVSSRGGFLSFEVKDYSIIKRSRDGQWSCTCEFFSLWSKQKKDCSHIMAAKMFMEEKQRKVKA